MKEQTTTYFKCKPHYLGATNDQIQFLTDPNIYYCSHFTHQQTSSER